MDIAALHGQKCLRCAALEQVLRYASEQRAAEYQQQRLRMGKTEGLVGGSRSV